MTSSFASTIRPPNVHLSQPRDRTRGHVAPLAPTPALSGCLAQHYSPLTAFRLMSSHRAPRVGVHPPSIHRSYTHVFLMVQSTECPKQIHLNIIRQVLQQEPSSCVYICSYIVRRQYIINVRTRVARARHRLCGRPKNLLSRAGPPRVSRPCASSGVLCGIQYTYVGASLRVGDPLRCANRRGSAKLARRDESSLRNSGFVRRESSRRRSGRLEESFVRRESSRRTSARRESVVRYESSRLSGLRESVVRRESSRFSGRRESVVLCESSRFSGRRESVVRYESSRMRAR